VPAAARLQGRHEEAKMASTVLSRGARLGALAAMLAALPLAAGAQGGQASPGKDRAAARSADAGKAAAAGKKTPKTLYERLGGRKAIAAVVDDFTVRVMKDDRINGKFGKSDDARLRRMLVEQICEATGGPCKYAGRDMKKAHAGMGVTSGEFDALVEDLVASLDHFKVGKAEQDELLAALAPMKKDIVEVDTPDTGTPLPPGFSPAPPLKR
jgi:hemoglobin